MQGASAASDVPMCGMGRPGIAGLRRKECLRLVGRLRRLQVATTTRCYEAGENIFLTGEPADGLYVLSEGLAKLSKRYPGSKEVSLRLIGPWEIFGDLAPGVPLVQGARAHAFTGCEVTKVPKVFVERVVRTDREAAASLLTLMGLELTHSRELAGCLLAHTTEARIAVLLPMLAESFGEPDAEGKIVLPPLTHFDVAGMVATTRESVTVAMRSLRRQGLLKKEGQTITILEPTGLAEAASRQTQATAPSPARGADPAGGVGHGSGPEGPEGAP